MVSVEILWHCRRPPATTGEAAKAEPGASQDQAYAWQSLFDGKTLGKWTITRFGGEGEVTVKDGTTVLGMGNPMTGITWTGEVIRDNYELELEAKRTSGIDFFATTTLPVGDSYRSFRRGRLGRNHCGAIQRGYARCLGKRNHQIQGFRGQSVVSDPNPGFGAQDRVLDRRRENGRHQARAGRKFSIRMECDLCRPLGIATWCTESVLRNIRIRRLSPQEVTDIAEGLR